MNLILLCYLRVISRSMEGIKSSIYLEIVKRGNYTSDAITQINGGDSFVRALNSLSSCLLMVDKYPTCQCKVCASANSHINL
ncbi:unnamed protein product [Camellia sinensis]